jgi:hypothetical protein
LLNGGAGDVALTAAPNRRFAQEDSKNGKPPGCIQWKACA